MKKQKTLLILAAGMGSRFGGLKQIEPIDDAGNFIIDYSIFDAVKVGFDKVVFVIKEENLEVFKDTIGKRIEKHIKVEYAFQSLDDCVDNVPEGRQKPWGTAQAVLCARNKIAGDFLTLNADDFYGRDAYETADKFFKGNKDAKNYGLIGYKVGNTLSLNGRVKRGVCEVKNGLVDKIAECSIEINQGKIIAYKPFEENGFELDFNHFVSMNMMCLNSDIFGYLEKYFKKFVKKCKDKIKDECLIQDVMISQTREENATVAIAPTKAVWYGVTYKEDKPGVVEFIKKEVEKGSYPQNLWGE